MDKAKLNQLKKLQDETELMHSKVLDKDRELYEKVAEAYKERFSTDRAEFDIDYDDEDCAPRGFITETQRDKSGYDVKGFCKLKSFTMGNKFHNLPTDITIYASDRDCEIEHLSLFSLDVSLYEIANSLLEKLEEDGKNTEKDLAD